MGMGVGAERAAEPGTHAVEALTRQCQNFASPRQAAGERKQ